MTGKEKLVELGFEELEYVYIADYSFELDEDETAFGFDNNSWVIVFNHTYKHYIIHCGYDETTQPISLELQETFIQYLKGI